MLLRGGLDASPCVVAFEMLASLVSFLVVGISDTIIEGRKDSVFVVAGSRLSWGRDGGWQQWLWAVALG